MEDARSGNILSMSGSHPDSQVGKRSAHFTDECQRVGLESIGNETQSVFHVE